MAYKAGKLTGKEQSRIQRWALGYHQFSETRNRSDEIYEIKKLLHFILRATNDKLYDIAFPDVDTGVDDPDALLNHTYGVDDLEGMEKLISYLGREQRKTQASLNGSEWTSWE